MDRIVEICCGSYEDALASYHGGAKRVELNSALHLGGLTPSLGALRLVKSHTKLKVICMIRPRGAGFCYSDEEFACMKEDAKLMLENGADGICFGFLRDDGSIDEMKTKEMVELAKRYHKEAVFHRAFDCVKDADKSMETLISIGINRVLSSGLEAKAMEGKDLLKHLQSTYGEKIEILAGSGVNANNAKELMEYTGLSQVHSSCKAYKTDPTTKGNHVSYAYMNGEEELCFDVVDEELVRKLVQSI